MKVGSYAMLRIEYVITPRAKYIVIPLKTRSNFFSTLTRSFTATIDNG